MLRSRISPRYLVLCLLAAVAAQPSIAAIPATVSKAGLFVQEMMSRGTADISVWPDNQLASPVDQVSYSAKQPCILVIAAHDGRHFQIDLAKAAAVSAVPSSNPPQSHVEILGGVASYKGVDIFLGNTELMTRVGAAFAAMHQGCDTAPSMGF